MIAACGGGTARITADAVARVPSAIRSDKPAPVRATEATEVSGRSDAGGSVATRVSTSAPRPALSVTKTLPKPAGPAGGPAAARAAARKPRRRLRWRASTSASRGKVARSDKRSGSPEWMPAISGWPRRSTAS